MLARCQHSVGLHLNLLFAVQPGGPIAGSAASSASSFSSRMSQYNRTHYDPGRLASGRTLARAATCFERSGAHA